MDYCCKVGKILAHYGLTHSIGDGDVEQYLLARWRGEGEYTATGLRPLKDWLNRQVLKSVYTEHDRNTLANRIVADYDAVSGEEADLAVLSDLEADGIDVESLRADFLSTTTLYRHFTNCLDASKQTQNTESPEASAWEANKVDHARDVVKQSVVESLRSLENKDRVPKASQAEVKTEIIIGCPHCGTQVSFERAVDRGYICRNHMTGESLDTDDGVPTNESN